MRLTDELLRASDNCSLELMGHALMLAANGRFGLLPSTRPFDLMLNVTKEWVDVESLNCLAVTRDGQLIDVNYDTRYTSNVDNHVKMPQAEDLGELYLCIQVRTGEWHDAGDGYETPVYAFSLVAPETAIPDNAFPIAHLVDDHGWRADEVDFVPPCLFVSSHRKFEELLLRFNDLLKTLETKAYTSRHKNGKGRNAIRLFWPLVQQLRISANKECDLMTPMTLLSFVQKCVSAFTCACDMDDDIGLPDEKSFRSYVMAPCTYEDAYLRIKNGLDLCYQISEKVDKIAAQLQQQPIPQPQPKPDPARPAAPFIAPENLQQVCTELESEIPILCTGAATVFFTTDGSEPSAYSKRASKTTTGITAKFKNGYSVEKGTEPPKTMVIKLMAVVNGVSSPVSSFNLQLSKSQKFKDVRKI